MTIIECQEFLWNLSRPNVPFDRKINRGFWSTTLPEFIPLWCKRDDKTRKWSLIPGLEIKSPFFRLKTERDLVPNVFDLLLADDDIDEVVP